MRVVHCERADGQTDRHNEANSRFSQFCNKHLKLYMVFTMNLWVLYGLQSKQQLLPYTTLTEMIFNLGRKSFTVRYALSPSKKGILSIRKGLLLEDFCHWLHSPYRCVFISQRDITINPYRTNVENRVSS